MCVCVCVCQDDAFKEVYITNFRSFFWPHTKGMELTNVGWLGFMENEPLQVI